MKEKHLLKACVLYLLCGVIICQIGCHTSASGQTKIPALVQAVKNKNISEVKRLLDNGADVNARQKTGRSYYAGNLKSQKDVDGMTPLILAAGWGDVKMIALLLDKGALINAREADGRTALIWAATAEKVENLEILLKHGANAQLTDKKGKNAEYWAAGNEKITPLLRKHTKKSK
jgi:uncharacterized protein